MPLQLPTVTYNPTRGEDRVDLGRNKYHLLRSLTQRFNTAEPLLPQCARPAVPHSPPTPDAQCAAANKKRLLEAVASHSDGETTRPYDLPLSMLKDQCDFHFSLGDVEAYRATLSALLDVHHGPVDQALWKTTPISATLADHLHFGTELLKTSTRGMRDPPPHSPLLPAEMAKDSALPPLTDDEELGVRRFMLRLLAEEFKRTCRRGHGHTSAARGYHELIGAPRLETDAQTASLGGVSSVKCAKAQVRSAWSCYTSACAPLLYAL
jgi:hypothetical protein